MMNTFFISALLLFVAPVWSRSSALQEDGSKDSDALLQQQQGNGFTVVSGWTYWGDWSACSRSCDGGASSRSRQCLRKSGCRGDRIKYRICNMQPCFDNKDFRDVQCSAYDKDLYDGQFHSWTAIYNPIEPCTLSCKSNNTGSVVNFFPQVQDGTRCRKGSLDMCIAGSCMTVGCDLNLGSTKKIDECGICGGDGSTCRHSSYHWKQNELSPCTVSCGGGSQSSRPECRNRGTGETADEWYCDATVRPRPIVQECNIVPCPSVWQTESWSECSATCGGGTQWRAVYCVEGRRNGTQVRMDDRRCPPARPQAERLCNNFKCPQWAEGLWSECSVSCGSGYRTRPVICRTTNGLQSQTCNIKQKPPNRERCDAPINCGGSKRKHNVVDKSRKLPEPQHQNSASQKPRFIAGDWGPCSVTCGWGVRHREIRCKVYVEFSGEVVLSEEDCVDDSMPVKKEKCFLKPCDFSTNKLDESNAVNKNNEGEIDFTVPGEGHTWRTSGFTACSASCLGGVRESVTQCIRNKDDAVVSPRMCDLSTKPDQLIQTCNNRPCPPRWNISDFSTCSKSCGGGKQHRNVHCIHEITRGNVLSVADSLCPQPAPRTERLCGVISCPIKWKTESWSQCSKSCGGGVKTRVVKCQRTLAYGQIVDQPSSRCRRRKPRMVKACKTRACPKHHETRSPKIISDVRQVFVQTKMKKKVSLKVGGKATVYKGVNLKLKCRVKGRFDRSKLIWIKDRDFIKAHKRFSISKNGALRIKSVTYGDSGFYMCKAHQTQANITVVVKPLVDTPAETFYNSIEDADRVDKKYTVNRHRSRKRKKNRKKKRPKSKVKTENNKDNNYSHEDDDSRNRKKIHYKPKVDFSSSIEFTQNGKGSIYSNQKDKSQSVEKGGFDTFEYEHGQSTRRRIYRPLSLESHELNGPRNNDDIKTRMVATPPPIYGVFDSSTRSSSRSGMKELLTQMYATPPLADRFTSIEESSHEELLTNNDDQRDKKVTDDFRWKIGRWSKCSVDCGQTGFQVRTTQCFIKLSNTTKIVDKMLCVDAGLPAPNTIKQCGATECPRWSTGEWSRCSRSRCVAKNTAMMRRKIRCKFNNGTLVANTMCNKKTRPRQKRECFNEQCKGTWKVGHWSECPSSCEGKDTYKRRLLQCVWYNTNKPAGNACKEVTRPAVAKLCKNHKCFPKDQCADRTRYCSLANHRKICRIHYYKVNCCLSCSKL